jgi:hypothetical protein
MTNAMRSGASARGDRRIQMASPAAEHSSSVGAKVRVVGALCMFLAGCGGRSSSEKSHGASGGSAGAAAAGVDASGGGNAGEKSDGDAGAGSAGRAPLPMGGAGNTGDAGDAGASNIAGNGGNTGPGGSGGAPPVVDHSVARFPIPNSVYSGLPHPLSYDRSVPTVVHDNVTGLTWQASIGVSNVYWDGATSYCDALSLAGHDDWRLPSRIELVTLMAARDEVTPLGPNDFPYTYEQLLWSSSLVEGSPDAPIGWAVHLGGYGVDAPPSTQKASIMCVRSDDTVSESPVPGGFVVMGDVVKDTGTGLLWERTPPLVWRKRADSSEYCANLELSGYTGWRLPSMQEMVTLIGLQYALPGIDTKLFPNDDSSTYGWFWSATVYHPAVNGRDVPSINLGSRSNFSQRIDEAWQVRCVHD